MKKVKEFDIRKGVRLKTSSLDSDIPENFYEIEIVEDKYDHAIVRSISHPHFQGEWWKKFIVNRSYYIIK